ncbi:MAG: FAD-dependent oxidoreductase [Planctomycetota bacterium]
MNEAHSLVVIGGGICGLAAAEEATRLGCRVVVIEQQATCGGLLRTDRRDGFAFDRGGHRFITSLPWVLERVTALLGPRLLLRERRSFILFEGERIAYPLEVRDLLRKLGPRANAHALASYLWARLRRPRSLRPEASLEDWLRDRFGDYLYNRVFAGYSHKLWGRPAAEISAEWAPQRISIPSLGGFLRELLRPSKQPPRTYARRYLYPKTGIGEIPEAFARVILERGGEIHDHTTLRSLEPERGGWIVQVDGPGGPRAIRARAVVSTIPLDALVASLRVPHAPPAPRLGYRGLRFVNLGFSHPVALDATWLYHPDPASPVTRLQIPAARSPGMVPSGCGSFQLEMAGSMSAEGDAARRAREGLALLRSAGFELEEPSLAFETTEAAAYPIYSHGARERAKETLAWIRTFPALESVGRQGEFSYSFFDRAIERGVNAARRLLCYEPLPMGEADPSARPLTLEARSLLDDEVACTVPESGSTMHSR